MRKPKTFRNVAQTTKRLSIIKAALHNYLYYAKFYM